MYPVFIVTTNEFFVHSFYAQIVIAIIKSNHLLSTKFFNMDKLNYQAFEQLMKHFRWGRRRLQLQFLQLTEINCYFLVLLIN